MGVMLNRCFTYVKLVARRCVLVMRLPLGISDFKEVRENDFIYVDKSLIIQEILETSGKILLITRPRRFGKTINLSMLRYFFESKKDRTLFQGLAIEKTSAMARQGTSPVIFLSFKDIKKADFPSFLSAFRSLLAREFYRHKHLLSDLDDFQHGQFQRILQEEGDQVKTEEALFLLSELLATHTGKKVILLIDEYDTPIHAAHQHNYYEHAYGFIRGLLGMALKDNSHLEKAVLTGILRVAKESIFSGLNNVDVTTLLQERFSDKFGFTEPEVNALLASHGLAPHLDEVRAWYNGYTMGSTLIYNPWSIINIIDKFSEGFQPFWINTSSNDLVREKITMAGPAIQSEIEALITGKTIKQSIAQHTSMRELDGNENALWGFLLFSGYLKVVGKSREQDLDYYDLAIPNREVRYLYRDIIAGWMQLRLGSKGLTELLDSLLAVDMARFEPLLQELVLGILSYHDAAGKEPERVYHAFVLGLLVHLGDRYHIRSNRESGRGRFDILLNPKQPTARGFVLEFKTVAAGCDFEDALAEALNQIVEQDYDCELRAAGVQNITHIAIAFSGKHIAVKQGETDC